MANTAIVWETHLVWCKVSFFLFICKFYETVITRRFIELWIMLDRTMSCCPVTRQDSEHHYDDLNALLAPKSILAFESDVCFGVSSRRPRKTNVKKGNRMVSGRLKATEFCLAAHLSTLKCTCTVYKLFFCFFFKNYWLLLYVVTCYHTMALFRCRLFKEGRRDQDWHLYIYCLTT